MVVAVLHRVSGLKNVYPSVPVAPAGERLCSGSGGLAGELNRDRVRPLKMSDTIDREGRGVFGIPFALLGCDGCGVRVGVPIDKGELHTSVS